MGNAFLILHSLPCSLVTHKPTLAKFERSYHIFHMFSSKKTGRKERPTPACPLSHIPHKRSPCLCPCFELEVVLVIFQAPAGEIPCTQPKNVICVNQDRKYTVAKLMLRLNHVLQVICAAELLQTHQELQTPLSSFTFSLVFLIFN